MSRFESHIGVKRQPFLELYGEDVEKILMSSGSTLHEVQKEALRKIIDWFSKEETKNLISVVVMPTGTGKSGVICCLPYMFGCAVKKGEIDLQLSKPILVIAPGVTILTQLEQNLCYNPDNEYQPFLLERKLFNDHDTEAYYKTYVVKDTDSVTRLDRTESQFEIVLCNAQKWKKKNGEMINNYDELDADLFSAIIVDEAHHLPAETWKNIIKKFPKAKVVFFTATPKRHDGREITSDRELSVIKNYTYVLERREAVGKRLIRDVTFTSLPTDKDGEENKNVEDVLIAMRNKLEEKNRYTPLPGNKKHAAILITKNQEEAKKVVSICRDKLKWENIKLVISENTGLRRKKLIKDLKEKEYELIIIVAMLLEGFDHPPLSVAGIVTKIDSRTKFAQFIGRVQRLVRQPELEDEGITGDIITADLFKQVDLYEKFLEQIITDDPA